MSWAEEEFGTLDLGDARLSRRVMRLSERLAEKPTTSLPGACRGWAQAQAQAACRLLAQEHLDWRDLLAPHWACTHTRMQAEVVVLCIADTTQLDFHGQQTAGLGPLPYEARHGLYLHVSYAVSVKREPLKVLDAWRWAREPKGASGKRPLAVKESTRWIEGYERQAEQAASLPGTWLLYLADRESDMIALMARAEALGHPLDYLIRAQHDQHAGQWRKTAGDARCAARPRRAALHAGGAPRAGGACGAPAGADGERRTVKINTRRRLRVQVVLARELEPAQQPPRARSGCGRAVDRSVPRALGNRDVLARPEERLPGRALAVVESCPARAGAGAVSGRRLAHCAADASGAHLAGSGCRTVFRARGVAGRLRDDEQTTPRPTARTQHRAAPRRPTRRLPRRKGDGEPGVQTIWLGLQRITDFAEALRWARQQQVGGECV